MRRVISIALVSIVVIEVIAVLYFGFKAYFIFSYNQHNQLVDGLGRRVYEAPWWFKLVTREGDWPGLLWFIFDAICFWMSLIIGYSLILLHRKINQ